MLELWNEKGQGLVEYALILVLVAIVVIAILLLLGPVIGNAFSNIVANLSM
ncbi:MAG: Flp family type IVb pilin [Chloroflexota bacterium]